MGEGGHEYDRNVGNKIGEIFPRMVYVRVLEDGFFCQCARLGLYDCISYDAAISICLARVSRSRRKLLEQRKKILQCDSSADCSIFSAPMYSFTHITYLLTFF